MVATVTSPAALYLEHEVKSAIDGIVSQLIPSTSLHQQVATAFEKGDYRTVKRAASTHLADVFCKAYMYLCSAPKLTPGTDNILAESARAAALYCRQAFLRQLGTDVAAVELPRDSLKMVLSSLVSLSTYRLNPNYQQIVKILQEQLDGGTAVQNADIDRLAFSDLGDPFLQGVRALARANGATSPLAAQECLREAVVLAAEAKELEVLEILSSSIKASLKHL